MGLRYANDTYTGGTRPTGLPSAASASDATPLAQVQQLISDAVTAGSGVPATQGRTRSGYYTLLGQNLGTSNALGVGSLRLYQVLLGKAVTLSRIGAEITAAGDAGSLLRLGIYADDGNGLPGALVLDAGTIAGDSATVQEITVNQALPAGVYWVGGAVQNVNTTQPTVRIQTQPLLPLQLAATSIPAAAQTVTGANVGGVSGALPGSISPAQLNSGSAPRIFIKAT